MRIIVCIKNYHSEDFTYYVGYQGVLGHVSSFKNPCCTNIFSQTAKLIKSIQICGTHHRY